MFNTYNIYIIYFFICLMILCSCMQTIFYESMDACMQTHAKWIYTRISIFIRWISNVKNKKKAKVDAHFGALKCELQAQWRVYTMKAAPLFSMSVHKAQVGTHWGYICMHFIPKTFHNAWNTNNLQIQRFNSNFFP